LPEPLGPSMAITRARLSETMLIPVHLF